MSEGPTESHCTNAHEIEGPGSNDIVLVSDNYGNLTGPKLAYMGVQSCEARLAGPITMRFRFFQRRNQMTNISFGQGG
jgi:hypothetical protein